MIFIIMAIRTVLIEPGVVNGQSMEPNFYDQEIFLVSKFSLLFREPQGGDLVQVFEEDTQELLLKRIIGLPGEQVSIKQNRVYIISEGEEITLSEPYLAKGTETKTWTGEGIIYDLISENSYFLLGDNRPNSTDSRRYGEVHRREIQGLVRKLPRF